MASIKPASGNQIKLLRKLSMRKHRYREKLFLAEGLRCIEQLAKNSPKSIFQVFINQNNADLYPFMPASAEIFFLPPDLFDDLSNTQTPQGILAICNMPATPTAEGIAKSGGGTILALDGVQDPGNLGTMIRTASWFGVSAIIGGTGTADPFHPKTVRSTAGATGSIPFLPGNLPQLLQIFHNHNWNIYLLDAGEASRPLQQVSPSGKNLLVFGNEGSGISPEIRALNIPLVNIPGNSGIVESLNVAMACGIVLYHFSKKPS